MKPWEEEWANADESEGWGGIDLVSTAQDVEDGDPKRCGIGEFDTPERRRLAAQTPRMARALLDIYEAGDVPSLPEVYELLRDAGVLP